MNVCNANGEVAIEFGSQNEVTIYPEWMRDDLSKLGISVPHLLKKDYHGFEVIYPPDVMIERFSQDSEDLTPQVSRDLFRQAVQELYFPIKLEGKGFYLKETQADNYISG